MRSRSTGTRPWISTALVGGAFAVATLLALLGGLQDVNSDARGTSVVAASILRTGQLTLTGTDQAFFMAPKGGYTKQVRLTVRGAEYTFPLGPVVLAMPAVLIARIFGIDAVRHDGLLQYGLAGVCILSTLTLTYCIVMRWFGRLASASWSILIFFGTLVGPTMSGAFWSLDCEITIFAGLFLLLASEQSGRPIYHGAIIGALLFLGFICRPTFSVVIIGTFAYLATTSARKFWAAAFVSAFLLAAFAGFSESHFGSYLPPYYHASRLSFAQWSAAGLGLLASPSRSIFIYSPVLVCLPFAVALGLRTPHRNLIVLLGFIVLAQFATNALFPKWWAGYSFGPRIATDLTFTGCLLTLIVVGSLPGRAKVRAEFVVMALLVIGAPIGLAGIYNRETRLWNSSPNIDEHPELVWDWRYPQLLSLTMSRVRSRCVVEAAHLSLSMDQACPR